MDFVICLTWMIAVTFFEGALGYAFIRGVGALLLRGQETRELPAVSLSKAFLLGLVLHLWLVLLCRIFIDSLSYATMLPLCLSLPGVRMMNGALYRASEKFDFDSLLWLSVIVFIGSSVLNTAEGLSTSWTNAYGDFGWHIGMIASFVFGGNLPPSYHIFPGQTLSYPFFVNLWSSILWTPSSHWWRTLPLVFLAQWTICWGIVGAMLRGRGLGIMPWILFFGGGTIGYAIDSLFVLGWFPDATRGAHQLIERGGPWVPFLTTIWVPQRAAMFGLAVLSVAMVSIVRLEDGLRASALSVAWARELVLTSTLIGASLLVHTHFVVMFALLTVPLLTYSIYRHPYWRTLEAASGERELWERTLVLTVVGFACAVFALPWLLDKAGAMRITLGWMAHEWTTLRMTVGMWRRNAPILILALVLLAALPRTRIRGLVCIFLFLAANCAILSVWDWDQYKFFIVLYFVVFVYLLGEITHYRPALQWSIKGALLLLLTAPALIETQRLYLRKERYVIYNQREMDDAALIRVATERRAVIAAKPDHNSPVTLTGRSLFAGYAGTLASHGLEYSERMAVNQDLARLRSCAAEAVRRGQRPELCPTWLLWTWRERGYWKRDYPGEGFEEVLPELLYRILPDATSNG